MINKQVACPLVDIKGKKVWDPTALSLLGFMYPSFRFVQGDFDIYPGEPFIYTGDIRYINKMKKRPEQHIIVSSTGEIDLSNIEDLLDLAFKKHNKRRPKYLEPLIEAWKPDQSRKHKRNYTPEFIYNFKHLWVTGFVVDKEVEQNLLYLDMIKELNKPYQLFRLYLENIDKDTTYLNSNLLNFMMISMKASNPSSISNRSEWMQKQHLTFYNSYYTNVSYAVNSLIQAGSMTNRSLETLSLWLGVMLGDRVWRHTNRNNL